MSSSARIETIVLPLRPGTATQVLSLLDNPDTSASEVAALVRTEPVITARLLALANSPLFSRGNQTADINRAIVVVGQGSVRGIALGVALDSLYEDDLVLDPAHWEDAVTVAAGAVTVAKRIGADRGEAFCAGLMHDIGEIAMAILSPRKWTQLQSKSYASQAERFSLELELYGFEHAELGATILEDIGLPTHLASTVRTHHDPVQEIDSPVGRCVALAEMMESAVGGDSRDHEGILLAMEYCGAPQVDIDELLADVAAQISEVRALFIR